MWLFVNQPTADSNRFFKCLGEVTDVTASDTDGIIICKFMKIRSH